MSTTIVTKLSDSKFAYQIERPNSTFKELQAMHKYIREDNNIPCLIDLKDGVVIVRVFKCKNHVRRQASFNLFQTLLKRQEQNTQTEKVTPKSQPKLATATVLVNEDCSITVTVGNKSQSFSKALEETDTYLTFERRDDVVYIAKSQAGLDWLPTWVEENELQPKQYVTLLLDGEIQTWDSDEEFERQSKLFEQQAQSQQAQNHRILSDKELTALTKPQLQQLCSLLNIQFKGRDGKAKLTAFLSGKINSQHIKELHSK